jgi:hypothetical protein
MYDSAEKNVRFHQYTKMRTSRAASEAWKPATETTPTSEWGNRRTPGQVKLAREQQVGAWRDVHERERRREQVEDNWVRESVRDKLTGNVNR